MWTKGLYQSNIGFKNTIRQKQKEIARKHRKRYWKTFLPFVFSLRFLLEFSALFLLVFSIYRYNEKHATTTLMVLVVLPEIIKIVSNARKKFIKESLNMQMAISLSLLMTQVPYWTLMMFKSYYEEAITKPYYMLLFFWFLLFPFIRHGLNNYLATFNIYKDRYALLKS